MPAQTNFNSWVQAQQTNQSNGQDAPLAGIDTSQYTYSSFIYPLDLGAPGAGKDHYMVFHINETSTTQYQTTNVNGAAPTGQPTIVANAQQSQANGMGSTTNTPSQNGTSTSGQQGNSASNPSSVVAYQPIKRVATTIVLYIPQHQVNYHAEWEAENLGVAADVMEAIKGSESLKDLFKSAGASGLKNAGTMLNELTDLNLSAATSAATRIAINPHMEVIFNGIGFRQFQFSFRFTAQSEAEALNIDNIIRAFKFYAAPEILAGAAGRFWIYPAEFDIQFYSNGTENDFLNKISTCALTDMQVNYTSAGQWSAHRPYKSTPGLAGSPSVCTDIQLTFKELEIITKERILQGY
jgi:hypothetical protein